MTTATIASNEQELMDLEMMINMQKITADFGYTNPAAIELTMADTQLAEWQFCVPDG